MRNGNFAKKQKGFTYLAILFAIALLGLILVGTGVNWSHASQREKEQELLYVGNQYRQAIELYYQRTPGLVKQYPKKLEDLLIDERYAIPQHYLRKLYRDPVTHKATWGLIRSLEGSIIGVHSLSNERPIKTAGFDHVNRSFEGGQYYSDWQFIYMPDIPR